MKKTSGSSSVKKGHGKIGIAEVKITPPTGTALAGYSAWKRLSTGVHDDLYVRCMAIEHGQTAAAMLSVPVCTMEADVTRIIRSAGSRETGIPERNILVHATHTHSAPYIKDDYRVFLEKQCVKCLKKAWTTRFPAKAGIGKTTVDQCGRNRRYLDYGGLPVDPEAIVIKVTDMRGKLRGIVFNYACHGTCLDAKNTLVTEDWPFFTEQKVKQETQRGVSVLFFGGPAGDINPGYSAGLSAVAAEIPARTWAEAERIGSRVGEAIADVLPRIRPMPIRTFRSRTAYTSLPLRTSYPITVAAARKNLAGAKRVLAELKKKKKSSRVCLERAKMNVFFAELVAKGAKLFHSGTLAKSVKAELQSIMLNDAILTTFPGEVFVKAGLAVKQRSPFSKTMVVGLANTVEAKGYMPAREAYDEGDYEVYSTRYGEDAADTLVNATIRNIKSIFAAKTNPIT